MTKKYAGVFVAAQIKKKQCRGAAPFYAASRIPVSATPATSPNSKIVTKI